MLPLQLKSLLHKLPKKNIFFAKLLLFSLCFHGIFLILLLLIQSFSSKEIIRLSEISDGATIVLVPLMKTISPVANQAQPKKEVLKKEPIAKKKPIVQSQKVMPKKGIEKPQPKKNKITTKPIIQEQKKTVPKKVIPEKIIPEKKEPIKKQVTPKEPEKKEPQKNSTSSALQEVGRHDLELIVLCNEIKEGIAKNWKRPANIATMQECRVKVCVHNESLRDVTIMQSSNALALDIMVKNFVLQYPFPKAMWDKEIELIF